MRSLTFKLSAITLLAFLAAISVPVVASPAIQVEKIEYNIGEVGTCQVVKVSFPFKNVGDEDLEIKNLSAGCSNCTNLKAGQMVLKPGESSTIEVDFTTPGVGGDVSKHIIVSSNDPINNALKLMIVGKVVPVATLNPEKINFGTIKTRTRVEDTILVTPTKPDGFTVDSVETTGKHLKVVSFRKANDGKGSYKVKIAIFAGDTSGRVMEAISIKAGSSKIPLLVFGNVSSETQANVQNH